MIETIYTLAEPTEKMMEVGRKAGSALNLTDKDLWHIYTVMAYEGSKSSHLNRPYTWCLKCGEKL